MIYPSGSDRIGVEFVRAVFLIALQPLQFFKFAHPAFHAIPRGGILLESPFSKDESGI
jgi:hypothetical protein